MKKYILALALLSNFQFAVNAQTGLKIYTNSDANYPNTQIVDMQEGKNKDIYLAGESKTLNLNGVIAWFSRIDSKGKQLATKTDGRSVTDIKSIVLTEKGEAMMLGNTKSTGGKSQTFSSNIDADGDVGTISVMAMSYAMLFGDAISIDEKTFYATQSNLDKESNLFNINVIKSGFLMYSLKSVATISSEYHEIPTHIEVNSKGEFYISGIRIVDEETVPILYALHPDGTKKWEFIPEISTDIENVTFTLDASENVMLISGYRNNTIGSCSSEIVQINSNGKLMLHNTIEGIKSNGAICLKNGNIVVYGANFQVNNETTIISKANYKIYNPKLIQVFEEELNKTDEPDVNYSSSDQSEFPTSSEFNCAIQLADGRIAFGGRIQLPSNLKIPSEDRTNKALVLFTKSDGSFR